MPLHISRILSVIINKTAHGVPNHGFPHSRKHCKFQFLLHTSDGQRVPRISNQHTFSTPGWQLEEVSTPQTPSPIEELQEFCNGIGGCEPGRLFAGTILLEIDARFSWLKSLDGVLEYESGCQWVWRTHTHSFVWALPIKKPSLPAFSNRGPHPLLASLDVECTRWDGVLIRFRKHSYVGPTTSLLDN